MSANCLRKYVSHVNLSRALKKNVKKKMKKLNTTDSEVQNQSTTFDSESKNIYLNEVKLVFSFVLIYIYICILLFRSMGMIYLKH